MLLITGTLSKNEIYKLPGGTTKLFPLYNELFTVFEEVGDLNYRITLPPYMKTHPVFYVGRLKRYVDPEEIKYPHRSNVADGDVDYESSVFAGEVTETTNSFSSTSAPTWQRNWRARRTPRLTRVSHYQPLQQVQRRFRWSYP